MQDSIKKGISYGITSGVITTLGLMMGLYATSGSRLIVISGILTIAFVDALSDSFGMHLSEESDSKNSHTQAWRSTGWTFISKLIFALTFLIPVLLLKLETAMIVSIAWGLVLLSYLSYIIAKSHKKNPWFSIGEHLLIAVMVLLLTNLLGKVINVLFV